MAFQRADFLKAIEFVLVNEGGYTVDSGGPTNWGVTLPDLEKFRGVSCDASDMKLLSKDEAIRIYQKQYWLPLDLSGVLDTGIATSILDIGVNRGLSIGAKYAQRVCNQLGYLTLIDGRIGPHTLESINLCRRADFIPLMEMMDLAGYEAVIAAHPEYHIYRTGWQKRAKRLLTLI